MVFKNIFYHISVILWQPLHLSMPSFLPVWGGSFHTIFFPSHWLLSHKTIVKTMECDERRMNLISMTISNSQKDYQWPCGDGTSHLLFSVLVHFKAFANNSLHHAQMMIVSGRVKNIVGKEESTGSHLKAAMGRMFYQTIPTKIRC